ncbi:MAG: tandem-95 repeat protein [Acidobacteria bacterium]|nr:tandem-95 repeat protein [Acidobacteriota bacterium]
MLTMTRVVVSNNTTGVGGVGGYGGPGGPGGGIYFGGGMLTMTNVVVSGNTTGNAGVGTNGAMGGSGGTGAGLYANSGALNLSNVTVTGNTAGDGDDGGFGGGIYTYTGVTATLTDCTITNNSSGQGGSKFVSSGGWGGGINNNGWMTMIHCVVSGNMTKGHLPTGGNGGSDGYGGGIFTGNLLTLIDTTVSGNHADPDRGRGGGIYNNGNALTLINSTITGNSAYGLNSGGYQDGQGVHTSGTANVSNTIIAGNGTGGFPDVTGNFTSHGHNLISAATLGNNNGGSGDESGFVNGSNGDQVGSLASPIDARLAPLADNGGLTKTHALLPGSPALDAGDNALAVDANSNPLATDQRGTGRIAGATSTVDIGAFEFHPSLDDVSDKTTNEDTPLDVLFNIGDGASGATVTATSDNQSLVPDANLSVTGGAGVRTLRIVPAANLSGTAHITLTVSSSGGGTASDSFALTVVPVNDAPTFAKGADQTVAEDSGAQTVAGWATGVSAGPSDESAQSLSFVVTNNTNTAMFSVAPAVSPSGALTYTPAADANGSAVITVVLKDDGGTANGGQDTSAAQTFKITVTPVNDAPAAANDSYTTNEDVKLTVFSPGILSNDTDADHDPLTVELVSGTTNGVLALSANGSFTYTPNANFNGADSFTYRVSDGQAKSNTATVSLAVNPVNDAPVNAVPPAPQTVGNGTLVFSAARGNAISVTDADAGDNPVRVTLSVVFGALTLKTTSGLTFSGGDGTDDTAMTFTGTLANINAALDGLSFTPVANFSGRVSLQITTNDLGNTGGSAMGDSDFVTIIIRPGGVLQFGATGYRAVESNGRVTLTVSRFGDTTGSVSVGVATVDDPAAVPCDPTAKKPDGTDYPQGVAYARCDYETVVTTVTFAAGDAQPKTVTVPLVNDTHVELDETFQVALTGVAGGFVGSPATTTVTIQDDDLPGRPNPALSTDFFVRQHYLDFLSREPDAQGMSNWQGLLNGCAEPFNSNVSPYDPSANPSALCDRLNVSANFFLSAEFQLKGGYVFRSRGLTSSRASTPRR